MKTLLFILSSIVNLFFSSADPNLFGSRKRRKEKASLANEYKNAAADTQLEIDALKTENPFESASAKSAMVTASRNAKQIQSRYANMLGGNNNPEALVAAQGATQAAVAGTAGNIAVGSEALKAQQIAQLKGEKSAQLNQYGATKQSSIDERGSGWTSFMGTLDTLGGLAEGVGSLATGGVI